MEQIEETDEPCGESVELCLFVAGETGPSARARRGLERLRVELEGGGERVEVIDVIERPDLAERAGILATPLLIRLAPLPLLSTSAASKPQLEHLSHQVPVAQIADYAAPSVPSPTSARFVRANSQTATSSR